MGVPLTPFKAGSLAKGVNENTPDFSEDIQLTDSTANMTSGIIEGIGPRYGFAPIPGHMDQETVAAGQFPGLMRYELGQNLTTSTNWLRVGMYALYPISLRGTAAAIGSTDTYYAYIISYTSSIYSGTYYGIALGSTNSTSTVVQSPLIYSGLEFAGLDIAQELSVLAGTFANVQGDLGQEKLTYLATGSATTPAQVYAARISAMKALMTEVATPSPFVCSSPVSITGPNVQNNWLLGGVITKPTATTSPGLNLSKAVAAVGGGAFAGFFCGYPSTINTGTVQGTNRTVIIYSLINFAAAKIDYDAPYVPALYAPTYLENGSTVGVTVQTVSHTGAGTSYTSVDCALVNDPFMTISASFQGFLIAAQKPMIAILQDWYRGNAGSMVQYVDPTSLGTVPGPFDAGWSTGLTATTLTGALRATTQYEFTYSVYDKRLNHESNVSPSTYKFTTGATDFVAMILYDNTTTGGGGTGIDSIAAAQITGAGEGPLNIPIFSSSGGFGAGSAPPLHLNYLEYRFYYRQIGSQEWLPALFIDAAKYWTYPYFGATGTGANTGQLLACQSAIASTPGGQPGDFNDYSPLPQDVYDCAVMFKNRAFWLSKSALVFSLTNNIFAYPGRNSASCPIGSFKGALVQAYYGQASQTARLVVFSTKGTYIGQFSGQPLEQSFVLDATSGMVSYPIDGSDFALNAWTSVTAFSYRSAVVAEGLLFFWGPQGIFLDDGVNPIQRISIPLEPQLFNAYDASQTDAIHCEYNDTTKEIWWFYAPAGGDANYPTHGICYNKLKKTFLLGQFAGQIDAVQTLHVDNGIPTAGSRLMAFSRQSPSTTVQRAYWFDQNNLAADIYPGGELMVKSLTTPSTGVRRLTLAAGHSTGTIAAGDLIALQQCAEYTNGALASPSDFIAQVAAVGSGTIDITLPPGATLDASATIASNAQYFPIWHAGGTNGVITSNGINGFPYVWDTKFWIPGGMSYWGWFQFVHLVYKLYALLPIAKPLTQSLAYQTPISGSVPADIITLLNNSAGNFQIMHPLVPGDQSMEGQGIKYTISGIQLAGSWVLQFLESYSQFKDGLQIKLFEG